MINNHTAVWGSWWHDGAWGFACCHSTTKNSYCTGKAGERAAAESAAQMVANIEARARADEELRRREDERRAASTLDNSHLEAKSWGEDAKAELQVRGAGVPPPPLGAAREGRLAADEGRGADRQDSGLAGARHLNSHPQSPPATRAQHSTQNRTTPPPTKPLKTPPQLDKDKLAAAVERQRRASKAAVETDERKRKFNSLGAAAEEDVTEEDMEAFRVVKARGDDPMAAPRRGAAAAGGYDLLE
jgi:hypothetical protein